MCTAAYNLNFDELTPVAGELQSSETISLCRGWLVFPLQIWSPIIIFFFFSWLSFSISVTVACIFKFVPLTVAG